MSRATIGIMVLAEAKKVATKSSSMVERMVGREKMKRKPSREAERLTPEDLLVSWVTWPISTRATMTAIKDIALNR